ncbi:MAG: hypothetical protein J7K95_00735 [Thermoplasmata archaeon]|nr:hypothetical protein [Thermoplasmata archaeon]
MIGLLTENFNLYYELVNLFKKRNLPFISLTFENEIPSNVDVIITSPSEENKINFDKVVSCPPDSNLNNAIDKAILLLYGGEELIFGIDPGKNIGIAIFSNERLIRSFVVTTPEDAAYQIKQFFKYSGMEKARIKIGNGARIIRNRIINLLQNSRIKIEIVDENEVASVKDDEKAAMHIAMMEGKEVFGKMDVKPREGEIREMQRISRIKSKNITISKELAKKVLIGEISLEKAIEMQKNHV